MRGEGGRDGLRAIADELGLAGLRDEHLEDLATAMCAAASWRAGLPPDPPVDVEPDDIAQGQRDRTNL